MAAGEQSARPARGALSAGASVRDALWRLIVSTVGTCLRYRVTGLAAEAAFFALLSLPPLIFALAGSIGYVFAQLQRQPGRRGAQRRRSTSPARRSPRDASTASSGRRSTTCSRGGRLDVISIGFILALWSGSRALNVFVDTITIMYGLGGHRGIVRTRALSFLLYVLGLVTGVITHPAGASPARRLVDGLLPDRLDFLNQLYWPTVVAALHRAS